ncbi:uncharacterized protein LOC131650476 [Vicia villosa]|uniref:uncharacterized protein LOC131650476 n=1 Tax=Vicia villosa TaxID=3911 RepID=UPI00273C7716|nr:uncharacterized protein LOC131650476 [Vicia villosa]
MSRPVERIAEINDGKELWKIVVRIHHRWNVVSNNKEHFEMIFVDKLGDDIHAVVPAPHVSVFTEKCLLGHTYTVSNFKVVPYVLAFRASGHKYMIKFTAGTSVIDEEKHEIPPKSILFYKFFGHHNRETESSAKKQQISMMLRDHNNNMLNCTLWESYADQFIKFNKVRVAASLPTVVLLQYAKVKEEGKYPLSVTNTYNVTLLCVDADFPVMKDFIDRMPEESRVTLSEQLGGNSQYSSQSSENQQLTPVQKLFSKAVVLPIAEIIQLTDVFTFCATVATTKLLVASPFGWYYRAGHMCQSIARGDSPPFECEAGHETMAEVLRYKIEIEVTHGGKSCNFVFWNRECEMLLGLSASQLRNTMIQGGITDPLDFPLALDQLLKLEMAMKVKWHPRWKNCSVVMIIKNDPIIQQLKEKWGTDEEPIPIQTVIPETLEIRESVDEAKTDANEDCELVTDLEITSEHKPDAVAPGGKRHLPAASSESTDLDGLHDGELSSNKLKKIIKMEKID